MKTDKILFPIDLAKCPLDALPLVNGVAGRSQATVVLLHIVTLNIQAPDNRVYSELCREAEWRLKRLADHYVHPMIETCLRVRVGNPIEEIVAEATEQQASLIVLPVFQSSFWKGLFAPAVSRTTGKLMENAPCPVFALRVKTPFNFEAHWKTEPKAPVNTNPPGQTARSPRRFATELCAYENAGGPGSIIAGDH